jgi:hypothetical protein
VLQDEQDPRARTEMRGLLTGRRSDWNDKGAAQIGMRKPPPGNGVRLLAQRPQEEHGLEVQTTEVAYETQYENTADNASGS